MNRWFPKTYMLIMILNHKSLSVSAFTLFSRSKSPTLFIFVYFTEWIGEHILRRAWREDLALFLATFKSWQPALLLILLLAVTMLQMKDGWYVHNISEWWNFITIQVTEGPVLEIVNIYVWGGRYFVLQTIVCGGGLLWPSCEWPWSIMLLASLIRKHLTTRSLQHLCLNGISFLLENRSWNESASWWTLSPS